MPAVFNVDFIDNPENTVNIYGSKAVGEPPLLLGVAVWTAVKHALSFVSAGAAVKLDLPATGEEVSQRLAKYEEAATKEPREKKKRTTPIALGAES